MKFFNYIMTCDDGFAPNPFGGIPTLAICKPQIRNSAKTGDWIAGWCGNILCKCHQNEERLVYLAKVKEVITMDQYWRDYDFKKVPSKCLGHRDSAQCFGDNIYKLNSYGNYEQQNTNDHNDDKSRKRDLRSQNILIFDNTAFYYFPVVNNNTEGTLKIDDDIRVAHNMGVGFRYSLDIKKNNALIEHAKKEFECRFKASGCKNIEDYILSLRFPGGQVVKSGICRNK